MNRVRSGRAGGVVALAAVLALGGLGVLAAREPGFPQIPPHPADDGVWIVHAERGLAGRVNPGAARLESGLALDGDRRLIQDTSAGVALLLDPAAARLQLVDRATVTLGAGVGLPPDALVTADGGTVAIADPVDGRIWTAPLTDLAAADTAVQPPRATVGAAPVLVADVTGTVHATAAGSGRLTRIGPDGATTETELPGGPVSRPLLTAVGTQPVVLDAADGSIRVADNVLTAPGLSGGLLQQPGPAADTVVIATAAAVLAVDLTDGSTSTLLGAGYAAVAPVVDTAGCVTASGTAGVATACPDGPTRSETLGGTATLDLIARGTSVIAADRATGRAWVVSDGFREVTGWDQVVPPDGADTGPEDHDPDADTDRVPPPPPDCTGVPVGAPRAADDEFGVRAGQATVLRVLDNDPATDCTAVRISSVTAWPEDLGQVTVVDGGSALQVTTAAAVTGALPLLEYEVSNGRGGTASAAVTVTVVPAGQTPEPVRLRSSRTEVEAGAATTYDVLADYRSPSGDDLVLLAASTESGDEVSARPDGTVTFRSTGRGIGSDVPIRFVLSDGHTRTTGTLVVRIAEPGTTRPVSHPIQVSATVGRSAVVDPRRTLSSGSAAPVTVAAVTPAADNQPGATAIIEPATGRIVVRSATAGTYYFGVQITAGDKATTGVLRADFLPGGQRASVVPMVDVVHLPAGGSATVDPLLNDSDPGGRGLAVQQLSVPGPGITAAVHDLREVRLTARNLRAPQTLDYTVFDGTVLATGQLRVIPIPEPIRPPQPLAPPIAVTVRAGDAVTIPVTDHAASQDGAALTVELDPAEADEVPGVLFSTGRQVRYLAPAEPPRTPVVFGYTVVAANDTPAFPVRAGSTITVTVVPASPAGNRAPVAPAPVLARVFAGGTIDIDLPVHATDPDGDWVTVDSLLAPEAPLGLATLSGTSSLRYTALGETGVDVLQYGLTDPAGATATGTVSVLVVPRADITGPPAVPDLTAAVRPGGTVRLDPLASVTDPAGSPVTLAGFTADEDIEVERDGDSLLLTAPAEPTLLSLLYTVRNERGLEATGAISVTVTDRAPVPPPLAGDILVPPADLGTPSAESLGTIDVSVAGHVTNRTGRTADLRLAVHEISADTATVTGDLTVRITLTERRQVIAYQVADTAGGRATAFIVVPPRTQLAGPQLIGSQIQLHAGTSVTVPLADHVSVAGGDPRLAPDAPLRITQGEVERVDDRTVRIFAPATAGGPAVLYLPVDASGRATVLAVPVRIIPREVPPPEISGARMDVEAGTTATLDLEPLTVSFDRTQQESLTWSVRPASGVTAQVDRSRLAVSAPATGKGTAADLAVTVTDGDGRSGTATVRVRVVGSSKPLPTVQDQAIDRATPGQQLSVDLLAGSSDPVGSGLTVTDLTTGAAGLSAGPTLAGSTATMTVAQGFSGEIAVTFTVADATGDPDREVTGILRVTVADVPSAPGTPVLVDGSRTASSVRLTWTAAQANGAPITGYTVTGGGISVDCPAAGCLIGGLQTGRPVSFTVVAHNDLGTSPPSPASALITPDALPPAPAAPSVSWVQRGVLDVSWTVPQGDFSPVTGTELQLLRDGQPVSTVPGLTESPYRTIDLESSVAYSFRIRAVNAEGAGPWSEPSAAMIPSGVPAAPTVTAIYVYSGADQVIEIGWTPPADTGGEPVSGYRVLLDGTEVATPGAAERSARVTTSGTGVRTVSVLAVNSRGSGPAGTAQITAWTRPTPPASVRSTPGDRSVTVTWSAGTTPGADLDRYEYRVGSGDWTSAGRSTSAGIGSLANGTAVTVQVRTCTSAGTGEAACSVPAAADPVTPYGPPGQATLDVVATGRTVTATWSWPADGNGRPVGSRTVTVRGDLDADPPTGRGTWSRDVGWGRSLVVTAVFCVTGPDECTTVERQVTTQPSWAMTTAGACGEPSSTGGAWLRSAEDCGAAGGQWRTGTVQILSCQTGGSYALDADAPVEETVTTTVPTTTTTTVTTTSEDPGPPPTTVTTTTEIPVTTEVTTTTVVPVTPPQSTSWYRGADELFYRSPALSGTGPPC